MSVNTVLGPIDLADLGWTLPHEHIVVGLSGAALDPAVTFDQAATESKAVALLKVARARGLRSMVDMTTIEMGRDPLMLRSISERAEVNIVCATGFFTEEVGIPHHFRYLTEQEIADIYVSEIETGIGPSGVKAGVIKAASGHRTVTELEEKFIGAAAIAHLRTGVPVLTHTGRGGGGERQAELLLEAGVPPTQIVIGHSDVSADLKYHLRLLRTGVFVGFDRIGQTTFMPDEVRAGCVSTVIHMGYTNQITMSLDAHVAWMGRPNDLVMEESDFSYLHDTFFPRLTRLGVQDEDLESIMTTNVARLFEKS